jgi:Hint domain
LPIRIEAGAFAPDLPHKALTVSPQHRCLVRSKIAERIAGRSDVLVAAKHLLGTPGVSVLPGDRPVTYIHLLFDRHELVWSNGAVTESLYLGEQAMASVDQAAREEILTLFPMLAELRPPAARPFLRGRLARKLVERSVSNRKPLIDASGAEEKVLKDA